jgi:hypothetical protein
MTTIRAGRWRDGSCLLSEKGMEEWDMSTVRGGMEEWNLSTIRGRRVEEKNSSTIRG